jgi:hypothetical protein
MGCARVKNLYFLAETRVPDARFPDFSPLMADSKVRRFSLLYITWRLFFIFVMAWNSRKSPIENQAILVTIFFNSRFIVTGRKFGRRFFKLVFI